MIKIIKKWGFYFAFSIVLLQNASVFAEEINITAPSPSPSPANSSSATSEELDLTPSLIKRIVIYLAILSAIGVIVVYFFKQGKLVQGMRNHGNKLKVCETHTLGNKQFLVVVEYGKQRILLGIGPGMINKLAYLEGSEPLPAIEIKTEEKL